MVRAGRKFKHQQRKTQILLTQPVNQVAHWSVKKIALLAISGSLLFSSFLAIGISELIIRRLYPQNTYNIVKIGALSVFKKSNLIPFELKVNGKSHHIAPTHEFGNDISTNSLGYRGPEFSITKPDNTFRILMLGDSTTFGVGSNDNETFSVQLENLLKDKIAKKVEVINAGFASGLSPDTYYLYLKEKGLKLNPDLVLVNIFLANDITDLYENDWVNKDNQGLPTKIISKERQIDSAGRLVFRQMDWKYRLPIIRNMHLGILTLNLIELKLPKVETFIRWLVDSPDLLEHFQPGEVEKCLYLNECNDNMIHQWQKFDQILTGFKILADQSRVPVIITLMPTPMQTTGRLNELETNLKVSIVIPPDKQPDQNYPQKRIIAPLDQLHLPYFDLLLALRSNLNPETAKTLVYKDDGHFTPKGNLAIAQAYLEYLNQQKLLP